MTLRGIADYYTPMVTNGANEMNSLSRVSAFIDACIDTNSIQELSAPHTPADADEGDLTTWGITTHEWSRAIEVALRIKSAA